MATSEQQLHLLLALDTARDALHGDGSAAPNPLTMFEQIAHLLRDYFHAQACALLLLDESSKAVELTVANGMSEEQALALCEQALSAAQPTPLTSPAWEHTLGLRVILDDKPLGSVVLARHDPPFTDGERTLMEVAESEIDSAIVQARLVWRLAQRNRELEAVYQIDRLRDVNPSESDLISEFTSVLVEAFRAELCMIILSHIDSGELTLRGVVGKHTVPVTALESIRELVSNIHLPQIITTPEGIEQLVLLAGPLIVAGVRLGAVVVGRGRSFTLADQRLLYAMITQMDSAIVHSRVVQQLAQRNQELEVIYNIDRIRDQETDFDAMLQQVLTEICKAVKSEVGYLMLYDERHEEKLQLKATTVGDLLTSPIYHEVIARTSREALEKGDIVYANRSDGPVRSIIAIPLILNAQVIGVFGTVNSSSPRGFNAEDRRMLAAITSQVDTAVFERLEQRRIRRVLQRSIDPKAMERLLRIADGSVLAGERTRLTVLFADLRGSTAWAERTEPEALVSALNAFLGGMNDVIFEFGGTLDKFVGDQVIALFGTPIHFNDHALRAVRTALAMQRAHAQISAELAEKGMELPAMGIGISTGEVIAGEIGSPNRADFTALGKPMNLGARLCDQAPAGIIYLSQQTYDEVCNLVDVRVSDLLTLKGIGSMTVYELIGLKADA